MFTIAEIAQAHDGSLGIAHSYIDALSKTGIDAVKFQVHIADAESSLFENFRIKFSYEDNTRYDYWKRMEFTAEQWAGLKKHSEDVGLEFIASPFSIEAVDLLEKINLKTYKVASGEVQNKLLIDKIGALNKKVILSSGLSTFQEIENTVNWLKGAGCKDLSILQCTTSYPCLPENWGLNIIKELKDMFNFPIGYSDHSGEIYSGIAAYLYGAEILEFHAVFDKKMFGPDSSSSLNFDQINELVYAISKLEIAINNPNDKNILDGKQENKIIFGKSLSVNKNLTKGDLIKISDLETKKPSGMGISASEYENIIGKELLIDIEKGSFLTNKYLK
jgi:N,N'-diacetyllegionaminate synthase